MLESKDVRAYGCEWPTHDKDQPEADRLVALRVDPTGKKGLQVCIHCLCQPVLTGRKLRPPVSRYERDDDFRSS